MKFKEDRPFATPEAAERKLLELANAIEADHAGRLSVAVAILLSNEGSSQPCLDGAGRVVPVTCFAAEIVVLRRQINILRRHSPKRQTFSAMDRLIFAGLYRLAPTVLNVLAIVKPETVINGTAPASDRIGAGSRGAVVADELYHRRYARLTAIIDDVRSGSSTDLTAPKYDFRYTPETGL